MSVYLTNAFSLNMLANANAIVTVKELDSADAARAAHKDLNPYGGTLLSIVGHADTAAVFSEQLGYPVAFNRQSVSLNYGDKLLVGQYQGPRLPEGATALPDGASIKWLVVTIDDPKEFVLAHPSLLK